MSDRQYGLPPGYRHNSPSRAQQVPQEGYHATQSHQLQDYSSRGPATRSPPRKPVAPYERNPTAYNTQPPRQYQSGPPSPPRHQRHSSTTLGQDNFGRAAAGGGVVGIAGGVANDFPRDSGAQALRDIDNLYGSRMMSPSPDHELEESPYVAPTASQPRMTHQAANSQSSIAPLSSHAAEMPSQSYSPPRINRTGMPAPDMAGYGYGHDQIMPRGRSYRGDGYDEFMDPRDIADDGDEGWEEPPRQRSSKFGRNAAVGAGAGAAAGAGAGMFAARDASGNYGPVPGGDHGGNAEKSPWLQKQSGGNKRLKWIVGIVIAVIIIAAIVGGVVGGVLSNGGFSGSSTPSVVNGVLTIDSPEVKSVMNNKNLHKVFPGMDYTPLNVQYPDCSPNQNNITLDVAVLSQLTPAIRLYGTDCDQTEMVLTAINRLQMNDTMKVWLGVWLADNSTTNTRQLNQMYKILDTYPSDHFAGIIIGNEVLFREDMTVTQLSDQLTKVRQELANKNINLPVATSDLGDDWTAALAADSDIVMSNVHPFFAGVTPDKAPGWTWNFWQTHDVILTGSSSGSSYPKNIISETGWPSEGGNDCGTGAKCATKTEGAIAGIDEMNTFMDGWVCQANANGTVYFWFEAFDEPWKTMFNDPKTGDFWEPHWGLLDVNRNLKDGVKIPDCNGKTVDKPY